MKNTNEPTDQPLRESKVSGSLQLLKRISRVPRGVFWVLPVMAIDRELKEFYFGWLLWAWAFEYGRWNEQ